MNEDFLDNKTTGRNIASESLRSYFSSIYKWADVSSQEFPVVFNIIIVSNKFTIDNWLAINHARYRSLTRATVKLVDIFITYNERSQISWSTKDRVILLMCFRTYFPAYIQLGRDNSQHHSFWETLAKNFICVTGIQKERSTFEIMERFHSIDYDANYFSKSINNYLRNKSAKKPVVPSEAIQTPSKSRRQGTICWISTIFHVRLMIQRLD